MASSPFAVAAVLALVTIAGCTEVLEMHGSGTTNPSKLFWKVMQTMEDRARLPLHLSYRAVGSGTGIKEFVGATNTPTFTPYSHFGSGDIPVDQASFESLQAEGIGMVTVPFLLGAISFFHSVPGQEINLTPCLLARIFQKVVTVWDDPQIVAINPDLSVPAGQAIHVVRRTYGSSSTSLTSSYLDQACPGEWTIGVGKGNADTSNPSVPTSAPFWPATTVAREGSGGVSTYIAENPYSIGYLDNGHGIALGLTEIELENKDGNFLKSADADIGGAATSAPLPASDASWADVSLLNQAGARTWPITTFSYLYIRKDLTGEVEAGPLVKAFAQFLLSEEGQGLLPEYGFEPVPQAVIDTGLAALGSVSLAPNAATWTFETSTSAYVGEGDYVFSSKRNTDNTLSADTAASKIAQLDISVAALDTLFDNDEVQEMHGSGTTNPSKLIWKAMDLMENRARLPLHLSYRAVGSGTGIKEFVGATNTPAFTPYSHFGSGDIPVDQASFESLQAEGIGMVTVPFLLGAISFFHSVPGQEINLTPCLLARIFQKVITVWDDPQIVAINPDLSVPAGQAIHVVRRTYGSSSTALTSSYLDQACPGEWTIGVGKGNADTSNPSVPTSAPFWPATTVAREGSGGVSTYIAENPYSIGYLDNGHGIALGLTEIELENKDGNFLKSADADIGGAATSAPLPASDASWADVSLLNQAGARTWPITTFSYLYIRKDLTGEGTAAPLVKALVQFLLSEEGQGLLPEFGFEPVPQAVIDTGLAAIGGLKMPPHTEWVWETSTNAGVGSGDYVFSSKRDTYSRLQQDAATTKIASLESTVASMAKEVSVDDVLEMHGSGTTNPSKLFWEILDLMKIRARLPLHLSYRAVGSGTGIKEFVGATNTPAFTPYSHFGSGDIPVDQASFESLQAEGIGMVTVPFLLGAISFFHSVPGQEINLTPCLLARIFQKVITVWDDPQIVAINPDLSVPAGQAIHVVRRTYGSSSTSLTSSYLDQACPGEWTIGVGKGNADTSNPSVPTSAPFWPATTVAREGSGGVSTYIAENPYSIGYLDNGHGIALGLTEIELENKDGNFLKSADADIGGAATSAPLPASDASWADVSLLNQAGARTWPITTFSYLYIRKDLTGEGEAGPLVKAFAQFLLSEEGQGLLPEYGFEPVPQAVIDTGLAALGSVNAKAGLAPWTFETSTDAGAGAGARVFSVKRETSARRMAESAEAGLEKLQGAFDTSITSLQAQIDVLDPSGGGQVAASLDGRVAAAEGKISDADAASQVLRVEVTTLKTKLAAAESKIASLEAAGPWVGTVEMDDHSDNKTLAIVGIILGALSMLVGLMALAILARQAAAIGGLSECATPANKAYGNVSAHNNLAAI